jgi:hypothetical protein
MIRAPPRRLILGEPLLPDVTGTQSDAGIFHPVYLVLKLGASLNNSIGD